MDPRNAHKIDLIVARYLEALESNDFTTMAALWRGAGTDKALEGALHQLHASLVEKQENPEQEKAMISLEGAGKTWDGGRTWAVRDVSLRVPKGQLLALIGTAGCGKSTVLKMINRLIEPSEGRVEIDGRDVRTADPVQLRLGIGYVIQGNRLFPHMTVAENIALVPRLLGWDAQRTRERTEELLRVVQLEPDTFRDRLPDQLSGGQQQRVGFARALAASPQLILLDEPFGALDPVTRFEVRAQFLELRKQLELTAVMVTHDMAEALLSADLIAVMQAVEENPGVGAPEEERVKVGRLLRLGTPRELLANPGHPFVEQLVSTPKREADRLKALSSGKAEGGENV